MTQKTAGATEKKPHIKKTAGKESILLILDILTKYSSPNHKLTHDMITRKVDEEWGREFGRPLAACNNEKHIIYDDQTIKRNLETLEEYARVTGCQLHNGRGSYIKERPFSPSELQMISNSIIFSKEIPGPLSAKLIEKLKQAFGGPDFKPEYKNISSMEEASCVDAKLLQKNISVISQAIQQRKQISFVYCAYDKKARLRPRNPHRAPDVINPYHILVNNGRYYLLCNYPKYSNQVYLRIDKMLHVTQGKNKLSRLLAGFNNKELTETTNLSRHAIEHLYMYSGPAVHIKLKVTPKEAIDHIADWFGKDFAAREGDNCYIVNVNCNPKAMHDWALQYGGAVEVLYPPDLRAAIAASVAAMYQKYSQK